MVADGELEPGEIGGSLTGVPPFPIIFLDYAEMMTKTMEGTEEGVQVEEQPLRDVRFNYDLGMITSKCLLRLVDILRMKTLK